MARSASDCLLCTPPRLLPPHEAMLHHRALRLPPDGACTSAWRSRGAPPGPDTEGGRLVASACVPQRGWYGWYTVWRKTRVLPPFLFPPVSPLSLITAALRSRAASWRRKVCHLGGCACLPRPHPIPPPPPLTTLTKGAGGIPDKDFRPPSPLHPPCPRWPGTSVPVVSTAGGSQRERHGLQ